MSKFKSEILKLAETTALTNKEIAKIVGCSEKTVLYYAGSYIDRTKSKTDFDKTAWQIQKTVLMPDIHHPYIDQRVLNALNEFIFDYDPDELVYMGDQISLECISGWNKFKPLLKEGKRLMKDFNDFNREILLVHENITRPDIRRTFLIGNHEYRINRYVEKNPELEDLIDIVRFLNLRERGYKVIPFNGTHRVGKLYVIHGRYWNMYHAKRHAEEFQGNVAYGHVHNPQMYTKISPVDAKGYHMATSLPCLCNIQPDYKENAPTHWVNGFGIVEHLPATGFFNLYTIIIIEGSFMWNGKYYGKDL
jgi:DNA-binding CsgD family transcriptional regulator/predicted phosphodiesterase